MGRVHGFLDYAITSKLVANFYILTCVDLNITMSAPLPGLRIDDDYYRALGKAHVSLWRKMEEFVQRRKAAGIELPRPSTIKKTLERPPNKDWYSVKEAGILLGVSQDTVRRLADSGRLKALKTKVKNGHRRFNQVDIQNFLSAVSSKKPTKKKRFSVSEIAEIYGIKQNDVRECFDFVQEVTKGGHRKFRPIQKKIV